MKKSLARNDFSIYVTLHVRNEFNFFISCKQFNKLADIFVKVFIGNNDHMFVVTQFWDLLKQMLIGTCHLTKDLKKFNSTNFMKKHQPVFTR